MTNNDMLVSMVAFQVNLFDTDNEKYLNFLKVSTFARKILFDGYRMLCRTKEIIPIEVSEDKKKMWEDAIKYTGESLPKEETVKYALGLYLLKNI